MGRKVGGTQKHTKKAVINKKYTPPVKTNISKHPKVYRPSPSHTTTPATRTQPAHTTGIHGASYGVTQTAPARDLQQNLRTNTVNTAHRARFVATSPITATYAAVKPNLPPSVQAAVHSTVSTVRNVFNSSGSRILNVRSGCTVPGRLPTVWVPGTEILGSCQTRPG